MTLGYRILWIDDSTDWVPPVKADVESYLADNNISPEIILRKDGGELEAIIAKESIDLIILDQGLPGRNGEDLIRAVRQDGEITEIIFYSQTDQNHSDVIEWEGVHYTLRSDANDKIREVIEGFIKRSKSISTMRGIIIAEAIDVENKLTKIIKKIFGEKSGIFKDKILDKAWIDFSKKCDFVQSCLNDRLAEAQKSSPIDVGLVDRVRLCCETLRLLKEEVINQRNILAHSEKTFNSDGLLILHSLSNTKPKTIIFDDRWKNEIRKNMKKHRSNLQEIFDIL